MDRGGRFLLALAIATVDRTIDRRRELARLTAIGTPTSALRKAHLWQTLPGATTVMLAAATASLIGGSSYLSYGGDGITPLPLDSGITPLPLDSGITLTVIAVAGVTLASLVGVIAMTPHHDATYLRDE